MPTSDQNDDISVSRGFWQCYFWGFSRSSALELVRERDGEENTKRCVEINSECGEERQSNGGIETNLQRNIFLSQYHEISR